VGIIGGVARLPPFGFGEYNISDPLQLVLFVSVQANLMLAVFNLLPFPPLDGFNIVQLFMPGKMAAGFYRLAPFMGIGLLLVMVAGGLKYIALPVQWATVYLFRLVGIA
ncbi:hypothetical protein K2X33_00730, partial [bacterium]|nr:hypothetical protein [bacterium]